MFEGILQPMHLLIILVVGVLLREAVRRLAKSEFDAVLFTTATQADHLIQIAEAEHLVGQLRQGLDRAVIASIGPTTTETLDIAVEPHTSIDFTPCSRPCLHAPTK